MDILLFTKVKLANLMFIAIIAIKLIQIVLKIINLLFLVNFASKYKNLHLTILNHFLHLIILGFILLYPKINFMINLINQNALSIISDL